MATPNAVVASASSEHATDESLDVLDWDFCIEIRLFARRE